MNWISSLISGGANVLSAMIGGGKNNQEDVTALEKQLQQQQKQTVYLQGELEDTRQRQTQILLGAGGILLVVLIASD